MPLLQEPVRVPRPCPDPLSAEPLHGTQEASDTAEEPRLTTTTRDGIPSPRCWGFLTLAARVRRTSTRGIPEIESFPDSVQWAARGQPACSPAAAKAHVSNGPLTCGNGRRSDFRSGPSNRLGDDDLPTGEWLFQLDDNSLTRERGGTVAFSELTDSQHLNFDGIGQLCRYPKIVRNACAAFD